MSQTRGGKAGATQAYMADALLKPVWQSRRVKRTKRAKHKVRVAKAYCMYVECVTDRRATKRMAF